MNESMLQYLIRLTVVNLLDDNNLKQFVEHLEEVKKNLWTNQIKQSD